MREFCPRCQCCELVTEQCEMCEDGFDGHDCGEDCCCCEHPEPNLRCQYCGGKGFRSVCLGECDGDGKHVPAGKEG